jgi:trehalose 6-phosphate synthase/trehalose 6-phosphate phosphatase
VAYLGDDLTDESAFRAVNALGGAHLSVLMRRENRVTDADIWLRPPAELRLFLTRWLRALEGSNPAEVFKADLELAAV